jgi:hypothetical protein
MNGPVAGASRGGAVRRNAYAIVVVVLAVVAGVLAATAGEPRPGPREPDGGVTSTSPG